MAVAMVLIQRDAPDWDPQNLPVGQNEVETGRMGDCVSVVVLWNNVAGRYGNVRGYHGGGGVGNVNFAKLFYGVPNIPGTLIIGCIGTVAAKTDDVERLQETCAERIANAQLVIANGFGNYQINRTGQWLGLREEQWISI